MVSVKILCYDRLLGGKLRIDSNSPSSLKGFIPRRTTKPADARKYKPHRPWSLPFCHRDWSLALPKQPDQECELRDSLKRAFVSFCRMFFSQVSLEFPSREGRCTQCWNYVAISIHQESFGINHKRFFFFFPQAESTLFFLCRTVWLCLAGLISRRNESRMAEQVPKYHPKPLAFTVQSMMIYLTNFRCENSIMLSKKKKKKTKKILNPLTEMKKIKNINNSMQTVN